MEDHPQEDEKPLWSPQESQPQQPPQPQPRQGVRLFEGLRRNKKYVIKASMIIIVFWLIELAYQYFVLIPGQTENSVVRSSALAGYTLIGIALIIGPLARLTKYNFIFHRRTVGVWGFTFAIMHMISIMYVYNFNPLFIWQPLNPFINPVIFGFTSFLLFIPLYLTSTDWAVDRLGFKRWKNLHRLIYFAFMFSVLHYILISPRLFSNVANFVLLMVTIIAIVMQVLGFLKTVKRTHSKKAAATGIIIILFGAALFLTAFTDLL